MVLQRKIRILQPLKKLHTIEMMVEGIRHELSHGTIDQWTSVAKGVLQGNEGEFRGDPREPKRIKMSCRWVDHDQRTRVESAADLEVE